MGAFEGNLTYRQYYLRDALPQGWRDTFHSQILANRFRPIDASSEEERALGWCSPHFVLDVDMEANDYLFNEYIVLGMRIDSLGVPGPLLKIYAKQEIQRVLKEQDRDHLTKFERSEIKNQVKLMLRKKLLPSIKCVDMAWSLDQGVLRFWSSSERLNLEFMELFEQTFDMLPVPDNAYTAAAFGDLGFSEADLENLAQLQPSLLVG